MTDYARTTKDELRTRKLLEGNMDVYQWFLMISSHSQRHILQIREIKAHAGYPKDVENCRLQIADCDAIDDYGRSRTKMLARVITPPS